MEGQSLRTVAIMLMLSLRYLAAGPVMTEELFLYVTVWATQLACFQPNMIYASGIKKPLLPDDCPDLLMLILFFFLNL